jgi:hypothetical protein
MSSLTVRTPVGTPRGFALAFAWTYFQQRAHSTGTGGLPLRLPLDAVAAGLSVNKPVTLEARCIESDGAPDAIGISWTPQGTTAFPRFEGTLTVAAEGEASRLALTGNYAAPGGIAGAAFDAVVGRRIARATIEALLQQLRVAAEADYRMRVAL